MRKSLSILFVLSLSLAFAQSADTAGPSSTGGLIYVGEVPSIAQQIKDGTFIPAVEHEHDVEVNPKKRDGNRVVPGKGTPIGDDPLLHLQKSVTQFKSSPPSLVFDADPSNGSTPSDPTGVVGPNHYLGAWNSAFRIFDKSGNPLTPESSLASVIPGNTQGDPIVLYDKWADRFIITEFDNSPNGFEMAICQGPDPVNDGWHVYQAQFTTGSFPDYTKFSIWSDGFYVTANIFNGSTGDKVWVVEREKMLLGLPAQFIGFPLPGMSTFGFYSPQAFNVTGGELPPPGNATIVYMQDNAWSGVSSDHLKLWNINVDWDTPSNSTISSATQLTTAPFTGVFDGGSFSNLAQPSGPNIDCMQATIMNQAQFRQFPTHNSAVFNFVVDAIAAGELAAVRWYELRQDDANSPWSIYQEGTYTSPVGGKHAFAASMAMDGAGNIGMGYTTVSTSESIAIQYTGRLATDPLNTMTVAETLIAQGAGNDPSSRYADYTHCTVDPFDEKTFWHIAEYFDTGRKDVVGVFKIAPDLSTDVGVIDILSPTTSAMGATEEVTIAVRNFGLDALSNVPVEFQLDGGSALMGTITSTIAPGATVEYTFTGQTVDLSVLDQVYQLSARTVLGSDEDTSNDELNLSATNLVANDIGIALISEPLVDDLEPDFETVTVMLQNFGGSTHTNFDVSFSVNGGTPVTETVAGPLEPLQTMVYTFTAEADMNGIESFELSCFTSLNNDTQTSNDGMSVTIEKNVCEPTSDCIAGDGIRHLILEEIDNTSGCSSDGHSSYIDQIANVNQNTTHDLTITTQHGNQHVRAWIDFNDSFTFSTSERVINGLIIAEDEGPGTWTATLPLEIENDDDLGEHLMRVRLRRDANPPSNSCNNMDIGETEDYKVVVHPEGWVSIHEHYLGDQSILVQTEADNHFNISLDTETSVTPLIFKVVDSMGRTVVENWIRPVDGIYTYELDMSYAAKGAYLIRIGDQNGGKITRIVTQ